MRIPPAFFLISALLLAPVMISDQSFWIDEGSTGLFAAQPDLSSWWRYLNVNDSSEAQMPLSLLLTWLSARWTGIGELPLRALNLLWATLTLTASALVGRRLAIPWLPLLLALQPYFWYYTGEARSYALQISAGAWLLLALTIFVQEKGKGIRWALIFIVPALILSSTTMLAPISLFAVGVVAGTIAVRERWTVSPRALTVIGIGAILTVPLAVYYLQTLLRGARGTMIWPVDAKYLGYVVYEVTGLTGLGPAVSDLREIAHSILAQGNFLGYGEQFLGCLACIAAIGVLAFLGRKAFVVGPNSTTAVAILCVALLGTALFFIVSLISQKALWARHYAPLFPFYVTCLGLLIAAALRGSQTWISRMTTALLCALLLFSSLSIRFAERHKKDDYRNAVAYAKRALDSGQTVWWVAGAEAAQYYGLPLAYAEPTGGYAYCLVGHTGIPSSRGVKHDITRASVPDLIVMSKPDAFDPSGGVSAFIRSHGLQVVARFKAFTVWAKPQTDAR